MRKPSCCYGRKYQETIVLVQRDSKTVHLKILINDWLRASLRARACVDTRFVRSRMRPAGQVGRTAGQKLPLSVPCTSCSYPFRCGSRIFVLFLLKILRNFAKFLLFLPFPASFLTFGKPAKQTSLINLHWVFFHRL